MLQNHADFIVLHDGTPIICCPSHKQESKNISVGQASNHKLLQQQSQFTSNSL
jgi:hypothetical protein